MVWLLMRSPWGRVLKGIREDEDAVRSLGKNVYAYKMQSLIIGGVFGALAGIMLALQHSGVQPVSLFATDTTFFAYTVLLLGGAGRVLGPVVGSIIFWFLISFLDGFFGQATDPANGPLIPLGDHGRQPGQPDAVHRHGARADAADDLPTTRDLRRPKGAGPRCPLTPPPSRAHPEVASERRSRRPDSPIARLQDVPHEPGARSLTRSWWPTTSPAPSAASPPSTSTTSRSSAA